MEMNKPITKVDNQTEPANNSANQIGVISTSEFLNFLKLACHVHETIILKDENASALDYNALAKNEFVNGLVNLKSGQSPKSHGADDGNIEKNGKYIRRDNVPRHT